jgi:penicillin-binding protein 1C
MLQSGELLPDMLVADVPTQYEGFAPQNFDEHFAGAVPASVALARSLNVPAVRNLRRHGVDRTLRTLRSMGLTNIDRSAAHYGLSLIMGGAECSLWEMGGAYASMARVLNNYGRGGTHYRGSDIHPPMVIAATLNATDTASNGQPPLTAASIHFTLKALSDVDRPTDEQGWKSFARSERIAWKTGTSMGHRDAWAIGVSDRWCVAVWTGNASGEGRPGLTGTLAAAPLMFDLFGLLPAGHGFDVPEDELVNATLCPRSGQLAGVDCPVADTVRIPAQGLRTHTCPYHRTIHVDAAQRWRVPAGEGMPVPWFVLSPSMERYYALLHPDYRFLPPMRSGDGDEVAMEILYPESGARLLIPTELDGSRGKAVVEAAHRDPAAHIHWDLDGTFMGTTTGDHRLAMDPPDGAHVLTLTDDHGRSIRHSFVVVSRDER